MDRGIFSKICAGALARGKRTIFAPPPGHIAQLQSSRTRRTEQTNNKQTSLRGSI
jgi:hypothetical protein